MRKLGYWLKQAGLDGDSLRARRAEQRGGVERLDTATGQRVKFEEVAGGVEAPADAGKDRSPKAPDKFGRNNEIPTGWKSVMLLPARSKAGRSITTAARRKGATPLASAVVIDLLVERERRHAAMPSASA